MTYITDDPNIKWPYL